MIVFFDLGFWIILALFFVVGFAGIIMGNMSTILLVVLLICIVLVLLIHLLKNHGFAGLLALIPVLLCFMGFAYCATQIEYNPKHAYQVANKKDVAIIRFTDDDSLYFGNSNVDIKKGSVLLLRENQNTGGSSITLYDEKGAHDYSDEYTVRDNAYSYTEYYDNDYAYIIDKTSEAAYSDFAKLMNKHLNNYTDDEIRKAISKCESIVKGRSATSNKLSLYSNEMVGNTYSDYDNGTATFVGEDFDGVKLRIKDEQTLEYISGKYYMSTDDYKITYQESGTPTKSTYDYYLSKNWLGVVYININDGQYKYRLKFDGNYTPYGILVYD